MLRIDYRMPLGLMIQPAAQIVRELPPRPKSYCVTLFFHAGRFLPLGNVWSTVVVGRKTRTAHMKQCVSKRKEASNGANPLHSPSFKMTKAVATALGRNPEVKTKGESMCNGF